MTATVQRIALRHAKVSVCLDVAQQSLFRQKSVASPSAERALNAIIRLGQREQKLAEALGLSRKTRRVSLDDYTRKAYGGSDLVAESATGGPSDQTGKNPEEKSDA